MVASGGGYEQLILTPRSEDKKIMVATEQQAALGKEVEIGRIEAELHRLWEADDTTTKASLINFAIYSESPDELEQNTQMINEITRTHACRAILIEADLDAPESNARAWITAHCHLLGGRKSVCSEQITFELEGKAIGRIRNVVFAHLESDLPLVFWWQGELSRIFEPGLYSQLDRLIVDSSQWDDLTVNLEKLLEALDNAPDSLVVHDLSWSRCYQLRLAFAILFDEPEVRQQLQHPHQFKIEYQPSALTSALLLVAWLADSLGWQFGEIEADKIRFETKEGHAFDFLLSNNKSGSRAVTHLGVTSESGKFSVIPDESCSFYRAKAEFNGVAREQLVPLDPTTPPAIVSSQLARAGNNRLYRQLLNPLRELGRKIEASL